MKGSVALATEMARLFNRWLIGETLERAGVAESKPSNHASDCYTTNFIVTAAPSSIYPCF